MSAIKTQSKIIKDHKYICTLFSAMDGYKVGRKIAKIFGGAFDGADKEINISKAVDQLIEIDPNGEFMLEVLAFTMRDDRPINSVTFNEFYQNNFMELVEALKFVVECNFSEFFDLFKKKDDATLG